MNGGRTRLWAGLTAFVALWLPAHAAAAANSPSFRDCSFVGGVDPDFVTLSGATVGPGDTLTVSSAGSSVTVEASESVDPGDNLGHDTLEVMVSGPGVASQTMTGAGVGHVLLSVPLSGVAPGGQYTLDWTASFDNGSHRCPGSMTPLNTTANPFVLNVVAGAAPPAPTLTALRESHITWRASAGTKFSFYLNERATVTFLFRQRVHGRWVPRGALVRTGASGLNSLRFRGRVHGMGQLSPGHYLLLITATNAAGKRSSPVSIEFSIRRRSARRA